MNNFLKIPEELRGLHQWVVWKAEERDNGKISKLPYQTNGYRASPTNPLTWTSFDEAVQAVESGGFNGIGFVFTANDPYIGIDIDSAFMNGELKPEVNRVLEMFSSYTEHSPSGSGFHIIVKGKIPGKGNRNGGFEIYEKDRYFTMTGRPSKEIPIAECQASIEGFHREYIGSSSAPAPSEPVEVIDDESLDMAVVSKASQAENGELFRQLYEAGEWQGRYQSQSDADMALCNILAFWTGKNADQMDRLFRQSKLYRDKWDETRGESTYGAITIAEAISKCQEIYTGTVPAIKLVRGDSLMEKEVKFLLKPYLPKGKITIIAADPGVGKTWLALYLAALLTTGGGGSKPMLFQGQEIDPINVWYQTDDDDIEDTLLPRFRIMGGDRSKIFFFDDEKICFSDWKNIQAAIERKKIQMLIFDPVQSFIESSADINKATDVRRALGKLRKVAKETECAIVLIAHSNKNSGQKTQYRVTGSVDFVGFARSVISLVRDENNQDRILAVHSKCNIARLGRSFIYHIEEGRGLIIDNWDNKTVFDLDNPARPNGGEKIEQIMQALQDILKDKPLPKPEVIKALNDRGYGSVGDSTIDRASQNIGIVKTRSQGFPSTSIWALPDNGVHRGET